MNISNKHLSATFSSFYFTAVLLAKANDVSWECIVAALRMAANKIEDESSCGSGGTVLERLNKDLHN